MDNKKIIMLLNDDLKSSNALYDFYKKLNSHFSLIIFGGYVRDILLNIMDRKVRDIDFIIYGNKSNLSIDDFIKNQTKNKDLVFKRNRFCGFKVVGEGITMDIWKLEDTWAFRENYVVVSKKNLLKTVFLNIDACGFDIDEYCFLEGSMDIKRIQKIDICLYPNPFIYYNIARAFIFSEKYKLKLSEKLKAKIREINNEDENFFSILIRDCEILSSNFSMKLIIMEFIKENLNND